MQLSLFMFCFYVFAPVSAWVKESLEVNLTFRPSFAVQVRDAARKTHLCFQTTVLI